MPAELTSDTKPVVDPEATPPPGPAPTPTPTPPRVTGLRPVDIHAIEPSVVVGIAIAIVVGFAMALSALDAALEAAEGGFLADLSQSVLFTAATAATVVMVVILVIIQNHARAVRAVGLSLVAVWVGLVTGTVVGTVVGTPPGLGPTEFPAQQFTVDLRGPGGETVVEVRDPLCLSVDNAETVFRVTMVTTRDESTADVWINGLPFHPEREVQISVYDKEADMFVVYRGLPDRWQVSKNGYTGELVFDRLPAATAAPGGPSTRPTATSLGLPPYLTGTVSWDCSPSRAASQ